MRYICLEYREEKRWDAMPDDDLHVFSQECIAYNDMLRENGNVVAVEALQDVQTATILRLHRGKILISDGPYEETSRRLGEILVIEATDLNHAIQLISKHPSLRLGACFEVRPADEFTSGRATGMSR